MQRNLPEWAKECFNQIDPGPYMDVFTPIGIVDTLKKAFFSYSFQTGVLLTPTHHAVSKENREAVKVYFKETYKLTQIPLNIQYSDNKEDKVLLSVFLGESGFASMNVDGLFTFALFDFDQAKEASKWIWDLQKETRTSKVKLEVLKRQYGALGTHSVEISPRVFKNSHYSAAASASLTKLRKDLVDPHPFGRLHILSGPPGTGKTSFIYGLLDLRESARFVLLPSAYVEKLQSEELLDLLLTLQGEKPIVLIIEDADQSLETRQGANQGAVSALLNAVDGLLSEHLDLRIIATTNLYLNNLDEALKRPGRLGSLIEVSKLSKQESQQLLNELTTEETALELDQEEYSLAEVYQLVNEVQDEDQVVVPIKTPRRKIGFN